MVTVSVCYAAQRPVNFRSKRAGCNTIDDILLWYSNGNKITDDEKKVLYIDLLFPHWFFGLVKNQYDKLKDIKASKIERIARLELSKGPIIKELLERL